MEFILKLLKISGIKLQSITKLQITLNISVGKKGVTENAKSLIL
jgi:hypothetical protein